MRFDGAAPMNTAVPTVLLLLCGLAAWVLWPEPVASQPAVVRVDVPRPAPQAVIATSTPLSLAGDCGWNVQVALEANGGALWNITIPPGATWSFNATIGHPAAIPYRTAFGVPGGCWCDLAARYLTLGRTAGLVPTFEHHGIQLVGVPWDDSVAIWNLDGTAGSGGARQDLELHNPTDQAVVLRAVESNGSVTIQVGR